MPQKRIKVISHYLAKKVYGRTRLNQRKTVLDAGRYAESMRGDQVSVPTDVLVAWAERRSDEHGPYYKLYCLTEAALSGQREKREQLAELGMRGAASTPRPKPRTAIEPSSLDEVADQAPAAVL